MITVCAAEHSEWLGLWHPALINSAELAFSSSSSSSLCSSPSTPSCSESTHSSTSVSHFSQPGHLWSSRSSSPRQLWSGCSPPERAEAFLPGGDLLSFLLVSFYSIALPKCHLVHYVFSSFCFPPSWCFCKLAISPPESSFWFCSTERKVCWCWTSFADLLNWSFYYSISWTN